MSSYYIPWIGAALITATAAAVYYWAQSTPGTRRRRRPDNADSSASGHSSSAAHPDSASLRQRRVNHLQDDGAGVPGHVGGSLSGAVPRAQPTAPISAAQWRPLPRGPVLTPAESEALMSAQTSAFFEARDTREVEAVARRQQLDEDRYIKELQEAEFQASLEADQTRDAQRASLAEHEAVQAAEAAAAAEAEEDAEAEAEAVRFSVRLAREQRLPAEPPLPAAADVAGEAAGGGGGAGGEVVTVSVRLQGGRRITRRFWGNDTVQALEDFVGLEAGEDERWGVGGGDGGEDGGGFVLSTMYPKKDLDDVAQTLTGAGIEGRSVVAIKEKL